MDHLKRNRRQAVEDLCAYLRFPSVSAQSQHRRDLVRCAQWLVRHCKQIGLKSRLCDTEGHPIVLAST
ncbi:MAG: peptidase M20, partial [Verrucomicrobia bacterium]|nr:peptidase M20 [Verrucomicrobiota bacterium]